MSSQQVYHGGEHEDGEGDGAGYRVTLLLMGLSM
jgi:hypothetical protein